MKKEPRLTSTSGILESDASDLLVRAAHNGHVAEHAGLHRTVHCENTREIQCTSDVPNETKIARHSRSRQGMRVGSFPSQGGDSSADPLHVQELSCE
jgi:hypothetical protein